MSRWPKSTLSTQVAILPAFNMIPRSLRPANCARPVCPASNRVDSFLSFETGANDVRLHDVKEEQIGAESGKEKGGDAWGKREVKPRWVVYRCGIF